LPKPSALPLPQARRSDNPDLRVLSAACDVAVIRALELIGKRIARDGRARYGALQQSGRAWHEAHTIWRAEQAHVDAALAGAWGVLPRLAAEHGCCGLVDPLLLGVLDGYVRDLVASGTPHTFEALQGRLRDALP
jgi:hypothetical protein